MASHIIDITDCGTGAYTKVRKLLNKKLGSPEAWDYDKPLFTVDCSDSELEELQAKLDSLEGIKFLPDHQIVSEVTASDDVEEEEEEEEEETAASPALVPLETEESAPPAPARAPAPVAAPTPVPAKRSYLNHPAVVKAREAREGKKEAPQAPRQAEIDYSKYRG